MQTTPRREVDTIVGREQGQKTERSEKKGGIVGRNIIEEQYTEMESDKNEDEGERNKRTEAIKKRK